MRRRICALLAMLMAFLSAGCGKQAALPAEPSPSAAFTPASQPAAENGTKRDGVFTLRYDPAYSLNPYTCDSETNRMLCCLLFEPLVAVTPEFSAEGVLSKGWTCEGGKVFTFTLREDVSFSDGTPLRSWDVVYALNRAREAGSVYAERLRCVQAVHQDNGRVVVTLNEQNQAFPLRLEIPIVKEGTAYQDLPLGTGPYVLAETAEYRYLKVNDAYRLAAQLPLARFYLAEYPLEEVNAAFDASFLDLVLADSGVSARFHTSAEVERRTVPTTILYYLGVNEARDALAVPERRRLVSSLLDRSGVAAIVGGEAAVLPVSPASVYYDAALAAPYLAEDVHAYGIQIMTEDYDGDGWLEYLKDGQQQDFQLDLLACSDNASSAAAARALAGELEAAGVSVKLRLMDTSAYLAALRDRDYDLYFAAIRLTPDFDLRPLLQSGGRAYFGGGSQRLDELLLAFRAAEGAARADAAAALYREIADSCPILPLAFGRRAVVTHRGQAEGLSPTWTNPFYNLTAWRIDLGT